MKKLIGTAAALAVAFAFSAPVAQAGVYVSGPLPSEFGGGSVPPNPDVFKSMLKGQSAGAKLSASISKCYSKGAKNVSLGKESGVGACLDDPVKGVIPKYVAKGSQSAPCSLPTGVAAGLVATLVKGFNPLVYCQSPSGAFVDGPLL